MKLAWLPGLWLALAACPSAFQARDPESEVRRQLEEVALHGVTLSAAGRELAFPRLELSEIAVQTAPLQAMFHVVATGRFGEAELGYYGSERLALRQPTALDFRLPRLQGVLEALVAREQALQARDPAKLVALAASDYRDGALTAKDLPAQLAVAAPVAGPRTISVRVDGDRALVTLGFGSTVGGQVANAAGPDGGRPHALSLEKLSDSWRFSSGLL